MNLCKCGLLWILLYLVGGVRRWEEGGEGGPGGRGEAQDGLQAGTALGQPLTGVILKFHYAVVYQLTIEAILHEA